MSFSSDVKRELISADLGSREQKYAECYGMLLFASRFSAREIIFKTENHYAATRLETLLSDLFAPIIEFRKDLNPEKSKQRLCKLSLPLAEECKSIFENFGHNVKDIRLRINRANLSDDSLYVPFLRGVFLSCGSVTDPNKGYHLELSVRHKTLADNLILLINEIDVFSIKPRLINRKGGYVVYLKGNDSICDFLGYIGAGNSVMKMIETSAYKEVINRVNRRHNSELANIRKISDASARQIHAIKKIIKHSGVESLTPELKELALLRLDNPEMSLKELGESLSVPISRSGVNHRIERLLKIADSIQEDL
ncbi:MAG: DNA-binding protein WhiA [Ruminococcus sp.]|nr:DNA-binding protein WhiA [Ruminococcus sp.]